jgi:preprotein translocase subunit YajC
VLKCRVTFDPYLERTVFITNAYAQTSTATGGGIEGIFSSPLILIALVVFMFFTVIRPQQKRAKEQQQMIAALGKGDEVVTAGGILGKITKITDAYITLEVADKTEIVVQRSAITTLLPSGTIKSL